MIHLLFKTFLLFVFSSSIAHAGDFIVRGGEHQGFTRLVFTTSSQANWNVVQNGRVLTFQPDEASSFNTSQLFDRISNNRVAAASFDSAASSLQIQLNCDCAFVAWQDRPGLVILDISAEEASSDLRLSAPPPPLQPVLPAEEIGASFAQQLANQITENDETEQVQLRSILSTLSESVTQGILEAAIIESSPEPPQLLAGPVSRPEDPVSAHVVISSIMASEAFSTASQRSQPRDCSNTEILEDVFENQSESYAVQYSRIVRDLYQEFDQANLDSLFSLIHLNLRAGFGAEARVLIENAPNTLPARDILLGLSDVLEGRNSNSRLRLANAMGCSGLGSLFAALAGASSADISLHASEITLSFELLPPPLQAQIGTDLAQSLIAAGSIDEARIVSEALLRSDWLSRDDLSLLEAQLDQIRGQDELAISRLEHFNSHAPSETLERLRLAQETGRSLSTEFAQSVVSLANSLRGSLVGEDLLTTLITSSVSTNDLEISFESLDELISWGYSGEVTRSSVQDHSEQVWSAFTEHASDQEFVSRLLLRSDWRNPEFKESLRNQILARLERLGMLAAIEALEMDTSEQIEGATDTMPHHMPATESVGPVGALPQTPIDEFRTDQGDHSPADATADQENSPQVAQASLSNVSPETVEADEIELPNHEHLSIPQEVQPLNSMQLSVRALEDSERLRSSIAAMLE